MVLAVHPLGVHREDHALVAVALGGLSDELGPLDGPGVHGHLVRSAGQDPLKVLHAVDAAPHGERNKDGRGHGGQNIRKQFSPLKGGGDVIKDQLVGPGAGVVVGQLDRVRHVLEV